jgi:hypothetical protein
MHARLLHWLRHRLEWWLPGGQCGRRMRRWDRWLLLQDRINRLSQRHRRWEAVFWALSHRLLDHRVERLDAWWQRRIGLTEARRRIAHVRIA